MKKRDFQKGAISVFLTIILVPSIVMSSIFVDLSRVKLAKGVATSSADLALNSLMSYYDTDLKDFYGMVASCQTIEQFYEESEQYFLNALYSQGLSSDDIDSLLALFNSYVKAGDVNDLLQMDVQISNDTKIVSAVDGASLGESSVLIKDQIVEFMKYRAPIEITTGIIERLKQNDAANVFSDADKNEELVESKKEYANKEAELLEAAFYTYKALKQYQNLHATLIEIKNISSKLETYRGLYKEINSYMVSNLVNTSGLTVFKRPTYSLTAYSSSYSYTSSSVYSRKVTEEDEEGNKTTYYYIDGDDMEDIFEDVQDAIDDFNSKKNAVVTALGDLKNQTTGQTDSHANAIQWWVRANKAINNGSNSPIAKFKTSAQKMLKMYDKLLAAEDCDEGNNLPADWKQTCTDLKNQVSRLQSKYLTSGKVDNSDNYLKAVNKLENISSGNISKINANNLYLSNGKSIPATISEISTTLTGYVDKLDGYIEALDLAIDGGGWFSDYKSLDTLKTLVKEYNTAFGNWKSEADTLKNPSDGGTTLGESDWKEINGLETGAKDDGSFTDGKDRLIDIKEDDVTKLKTRLSNIRQQFKDLRDAIKDVKYCGKKIYETSSYDTIFNAAKGKISDIPLKNGEITTKANSIFNSEFKPSPTAKLFTVNESSDYNPDLTVSKPTLFDWMEQKFKDEKVAEDNLKEKKKDQQDKKDKTKNNETDKDKEAERRTSKTSTTNIYGGSYVGSEFPSGLDNQSSYALGKSFIETFGSFVDILLGDTNLSSIRDTVFSAEYVMDMFSHNTYENEGKYHLYREKNPDASPPTKQHLSVEGWDNPDKTFRDNKTLTNMLINADNNVANGAEVEYILYGDTNKKSVGAAYADIFTIRYLLNTISGFQNFWSGDDPTAYAIEILAQGVATATSGIIPAPLTKTVEILLLAVLETGNDLNRLSNGTPVELYKKGEDWVFSLGTDEPPDKSCENGLFYSDYLYLFLFMGFQTSSASEMYLRVGDLMQANLRKYTGSEGYSLKNSQIYFKVNATIRVKPLMLALPFSKNGFSNNPSDKNEWCTFTISETRGYS